MTLNIANKALKLDALKQHLETMLSELNLGLNKLYLTYNKEVNPDIINYLRDLEHILNTGKNILNSALIKEYKFINIEKEP